MRANPTTENWPGTEQYQPLYNSCLRKRILAQCCHLDTLQNNRSSGRAGQRSAKQWPLCWLRTARRWLECWGWLVVGKYVTQFALVGRGDVSGGQPDLRSHTPEDANFWRLVLSSAARQHADFRGSLTDFRRPLQEKVNAWCGDRVHPSVHSWQNRPLNCLSDFHEIQCSRAVQNKVTTGPLSLTQHQ